MIKRFEVHAHSQVSKLPTMRCTDNPQSRRSRFFSLRPATEIELALPLAAFHLRLSWVRSSGQFPSAQLMQDADNKSAQGDFERAMNLYEAALDDSPRDAEVHYKLALLYDDNSTIPSAHCTISNAISP